MNRFLKYFIAIFIISFICTVSFSGCSGSQKSMCQRDNTYKKQNTIRNRAKYSTRYSTKFKPVRKDYVIRNKKAGKKY